MKLTQQQKIVAYMCQNYTKTWWLAKDFMQDGMGELYVGYEATARLAELVKDNPAMFETKRDGRFRAVRMRFETGRQWYATAPDPIKLVVRKYYQGNVPQTEQVGLSV